MQSTYLIELSAKQLDDLQSIKLSKVKSVVDYIIENVQDKDLYLENELEPRMASLRD